MSELNRERGVRRISRIFILIFLRIIVNRNLYIIIDKIGNIFYVIWIIIWCGMEEIVKAFED